jgi:hypothetical protein
MTTPLNELLAKVGTLNDPANPFIYTVKGTSIIGKWDIVSAKTLYPTEFRAIDKKFEIRVDLDERKGTWKPKEKSKESGGGIGSDGTISFGSSTSSFSGRSSSKGFSFEAGGVTKKKGEDATIAPLVYSWDTAKIKQPLFDFLEANGWKRKKGLFG